MITKNYYNDFFEFGQQKINFNFLELHLPDDDPADILKKVMEELDIEANRKRKLMKYKKLSNSTILEIDSCYSLEILKLYEELESIFMRMKRTICSMFRSNLPIMCRSR